MWQKWSLPISFLTYTWMLNLVDLMPLSKGRNNQKSWDVPWLMLSQVVYLGLLIFRICLLKSCLCLCFYLHLVLTSFHSDYTIFLFFYLSSLLFFFDFSSHDLRNIVVLQQTMTISRNKTTTTKAYFHLF